MSRNITGNKKKVWLFHYISLCYTNLLLFLLTGCLGKNGSQGIQTHFISSRWGRTKRQEDKGGFTVRTADIFIITINGCLIIIFWLMWCTYSVYTFLVMVFCQYLMYISEVFFDVQLHMQSTN